jgi:hypothetical protein
MDKSEYIRALLKRRLYHPGMFDAALIYFHSGIPIEDAKKYIEAYYAKTQNKGQMNAS